MKKKIIEVYSVLFFLILSFIERVSAQSSIGGSIDNVVRGMGSGISVIFGDVNMQGGSPGEILFIKLLVFILLFAMINLILKRLPIFGHNHGIAGLVAFIVALISVRFMTNENMINFIWLPYGILGVVFSVILPFIIGFFFIESFDETVIRKVGWTTYVVIFTGLTIYKWDSMIVPGGVWYQNYAWMYLIIAVLSGILLFFDKGIRAALFMSGIKGQADLDKRIEAAKIEIEIKSLRQTLGMTTDHSTRSDLEKKIKELKATQRAIIRS